MPKMKTKSGAKKRFKVTGTGKVLFKQSNTRHRLRNRPVKMKRKARGSGVADEADARIILGWMPYARKGA